MKLSEVCAKVLEEKQAYLIRPSRQQEEGEAVRYDVKPWEGNKRGWTILDMTTSSAYSMVYKAINDENKAKLERLPLMKAVAVAWKLTK